jgi:nucleotide-binding universal stress UspA family protein
MIQINRILCPVDFSAFSKRAFAQAAALARWYKAHLTVLHVSPDLAEGLPVQDAAALVARVFLTFAEFSAPCRRPTVFWSSKAAQSAADALAVVLLI